MSNTTLVVVVSCAWMVISVMAFSFQPSITDEEIVRMAVERGLAYKIADTLSEQNVYEYIVSRQHMKQFIINFLHDNNLYFLVSIVLLFSIIGFFLFARWFFLASAAIWKIATNGFNRFTRFMLFATRDFDPESIPLQPTSRRFSSTETVETPAPTNEAAVPGSYLLGPNVPKFQCFIASVDCNGKATYVGSGVRVRDSIYTVRHNLAAVAEDLFIYSHNGVDKVPAPIADWVLSDEFDAASIKMQPSVLSKLQLSKATLPKGPLLGSTYACTSSALHSSTGLLKPGDTCGEVLYLGSTVAGFSGAPYCTGKTIFGVHVGVSKSNFGYDILFMDSLFYTPEDSETFDNEMLIEDWKNKRVHKFLRTSDGGFIHRGKNRFRRVDDDLDRYVRDLELDHMEQTGRGFDEGVLPAPRRNRGVIPESIQRNNANSSELIDVVDEVISDPEPVRSSPVFRDVPAPPPHTTRPTGASKDVLNLDSTRQIDTQLLADAMKRVLDINGLGLMPVQNESVSHTTSTGSNPQPGPSRKKQK